MLRGTLFENTSSSPAFMRGSGIIGETGATLSGITGASLMRLSGPVPAVISLTSVSAFMGTISLMGGRGTSLSLKSSPVLFSSSVIFFLSSAWRFMVLYLSRLTEGALMSSTPILSLISLSGIRLVGWFEGWMLLISMERGPLSSSSSSGSMRFSADASTSMASL